MKKRKKLKRALIITGISIITFMVLVIVFISPITKYLVEKYSVKYTGRQVKMNWAYVNPFTGYVHFNHLRIYECNSDSVFFSADGVSANFAMRKMLSKTYEIEELTLNKPRGTIIQYQDSLNFDDIIDRYSNNDSLRDTNIIREPVHFSLKNITVTDGTFYYVEEAIPIHYFIKNVNISCSGFLWDRDTTNGKFSFLSGPNVGGVKGDFTINLKTLGYRMNTIFNHFDFKILEQYMRELANYGNFSVFGDANLNTRGNFNDAKNIKMQGLIKLSDFHFGKKQGDDYGAFKTLTVGIHEISPRNKTYMFDSVKLIKPFFKFEQYEYLDNFSMIFGAKGAKAMDVNAAPTSFNLVLEIARYITLVAEDFLRSDYKISKLGIYDGNIEYSDYTLNEKFSMALNPLTITSDSVDKAHQKVYLYLKSNIKPYGNISARLITDPKHVGNFDFTYMLDKTPCAMFNPFLLKYTSYPLDRGTIEADGKWLVNNNIINSNNHIVLIDPRLAARDRKTGAKWIPVPIVMGFIREQGNVIDYDIPITGDLKNPKFHFHDVLMKTLKNLVVKPATTRYRVQVKSLESTIEKTQRLSWEMRQTELSNRRQRFVHKLTDFLKSDPNASIEIYPIEYADKEKEYILFYEAKKKYYLLSNNIKLHQYTVKDSALVDKMSNKNPAFVAFIKKKAPNKLMVTLQQQLNIFVGEKFVNQQFSKLARERQKTFMAYMKEKGVAEQVKMQPAENTIPYNGFSYYKIRYKGDDVPEKLTEAYKKLNDFNEKRPRKEYMKERKKRRE